MISEEMKKTIFRRYRNHNIKFKTWKELIEKTNIDENKKLRCFYCNDLLEYSQKISERKVVSLDHKLPKYWGGKDTIENTCLCCKECNIIKGTMKENTYIKFRIILLQNGLLERYLQEAYPGKKAAMLKRKNKKLELWEML